VDHALVGRDEQPAELRRRLVELAAYVGGAFVVAAGFLFTVQQWADLGTGQRVGLLLVVSTVLMAGAAVAAFTGPGLAAVRAGREEVRRRLAGALSTGGSVAAAAAAMVWYIDRLQDAGTEVEQGYKIGLTGSLVLLVLATVSYLVVPSLVGQLAVAAGAMYLVPFVFEAFDLEAPALLGATFLAIGLLWLALAERGAWREVVPARVVGAVMVVVGAQVPIGSDWPWIGYLLTALVAVGGFTFYVVRRAWPYLAVGVVGITLAVPEALLDWTEGSLGTAGVLLVAGVTLLGASLLGLRLRQETLED
jgi:hypothetical protein